LRATLLLVLLAGCRCEPGEKPKPAPPKVVWQGVTFGPSHLQLPEAFLRDKQPMRRENQVFFVGPDAGGHKVTVTVYWQKSNKSIEEWAEFNRLKWAPPNPVPIHAQEWTTVGGRKAFYMLREENARVPQRDNKELPFLLMEWYLQVDGHVGFVRGICLKSEFAFRWEPVFAEMARRITYVR
jgi:hypothetical protein